MAAVWSLVRTDGPRAAPMRRIDVGDQRRITLGIDLGLSQSHAGHEAHGEFGCVPCQAPYTLHMFRSLLLRCPAAG